MASTIETIMHTTTIVTTPTATVEHHLQTGIILLLEELFLVDQQYQLIVDLEVQHQEGLS